MRLAAKLNDLVCEVWRGKSLPRILSNWVIGRYCHGLSGVMIDLGGGRLPSYTRYWEIQPTQFLNIDLDAPKGSSVVADINKPLPFPDAFTDHVFLFSVLYIAEDPQKLLCEVRRVLKPGGILWLTSPFALAESREPHDYCRFTSEGLEKLFRAAEFTNVVIESIGERFSVAASSIAIFVRPAIFRVPLFILALALDKLVPEKLKTARAYPLGYFCIAKK